jgi:hypothetical protein
MSPGGTIHLTCGELLLLALHVPVHTTSFEAGKEQFQRVVVHTLRGMSKNVGGALQDPEVRSGKCEAGTTAPLVTERSNPVKATHENWYDCCFTVYTSK